MAGGFTAPRRPNVLDVVRAVTDVAPDYPGVTVWWYAPIVDFQSQSSEDRASRLEFVVEVAASPMPDLEAMAARLSEVLSGYPVEVRRHRGPDQEGRLFRVLTDR